MSVTSPSASVTSKALWYIEAHLDSDISLDAAAESAGVSRFHLSRAFTAATGMSLAVYARARRLSEAAKRLRAGSPDILNVALDAGYGSHEAFTRAFRQHFGIPPEQYRSQPSQIPLQEPLRMNPTTTSSIAPPRIQTRDAFLIFGLSMVCKMAGDPGIPALWNKFGPYIGNIEGQVGWTTYGACYNGDDKTYEYLCGVEVPQFPSTPKEFSRLRVPPQTYAVFEHKGHISGIAATFKAIWEHGLFDANVKASDGPLLEIYGEQFDGKTGMGGLEIWIPIRKD